MKLKIARAIFLATAIVVPIAFINSYLNNTNDIKYHLLAVVFSCAFTLTMLVTFGIPLALLSRKLSFNFALIFILVGFFIPICTIFLINEPNNYALFLKALPNGIIGSFVAFVFWVTLARKKI